MSRCCNSSSCSARACVAADAAVDCAALSVKVPERKASTWLRKEVASSCVAPSRPLYAAPRLQPSSGTTLGPTAGTDSCRKHPGSGRVHATPICCMTARAEGNAGASAGSTFSSSAGVRGAGVCAAQLPLCQCAGSTVRCCMSCGSETPPPPIA